MADVGRAAPLKRRFRDDDDDDDGDEPVKRPPEEKKVRFPKGKKSKKGGEASAAGAVAAAAEEEEVFGQWMNPELAAKERARRRNQIREDELLLRENNGGGGLRDISRAEVYYEVNVNFEDDGIEIEPFNLKREREEGYFDANGNFVEYLNKNEMQDAWLDSVSFDTRFAAKSTEKIVDEEEFQDLSSEDVGKIKRSIANVLQPGETVIQALKRLKGSNDKKERMSEDTKRTFDKLTEDAMKLMESGEYNVYHEKGETFNREAEGYERLARMKEGTYISTDNVVYGSTTLEGIFSEGIGSGLGEPAMDQAQVPLGANPASTLVSSGDDGVEFDMFGDEDDNASINPQSDGDGLGSSSTCEPSSLSASEGVGALQNQEANGGGSETDYVFDESSGYYYSSSLGYYYDPTSGLYCCAISGKWYSFNEQTSAYDEIQDDGSRQTEGTSEI